ncbi:MAG: FliI/YscN family ATPase [Anaeromyxobacter sp.]
MTPAADALAAARARLDRAAPLRARGRLTRVAGHALEAEAAGLRLGDGVEIRRPGGEPLQAEVVALREDRAVLVPLGDPRGLAPSAEVTPAGGRAWIRAGEALRGRILDGLGRPIDGRPPPLHLPRWDVDRPPPPPLSRPRIRTPLPLGVRVLDGLLTAGVGQRLGLFAAAGVGKSTLLGQLVRQARADVAVVGLVGERGREVREFVDDALGPDGLARSVLVVATSDAPAMVRARAAHVATSIAEWFADRGGSVLLVLDSLTRYARALREVALAAGEPPARQGYPASVFGALPRLLERAGPRPLGAITAISTVLVAGDDPDEPVADEVRGLLDGHVVLDRERAAAGVFPAVNAPASVSRLMAAVASPEHRRAAARLRALLAAHARGQDLLAVGAYAPGADPDLDAYLARREAIEAFLAQGTDEAAPFDETVRRLVAAVEGA